MHKKSQSIKKVNKPTIIITSLGRTGTKFFQVLMKSHLPQSCSLHEPDVFNFYQYERGKERISQVQAQLKEVGPFNLFVRKPLGLWSLMDISDGRVCGAIDFSSALKKVHHQRYNFVKKVTGSPYIESNAGYYGLLDILDRVFDQYRAVYIVRDGRDWIQSEMNWGQMYGKGKFQKLFAHTWPTAVQCGEVSNQVWESMTRFEKLCWAWVRLNEYAINSLAGNPNIILIKFENIFSSENKYQSLEELLTFLTSFKTPLKLDINSMAGWLEKRIHGSEGRFPKWVDWTLNQRDYFHKTCGPLMERLDYHYDYSD
jgi:hypothetical protein